MMILGVRATITRPSPADTMRVFISAAHVVTVNDHSKGGVMVDTSRGPVHVIEAEGIDGDDLTVDTFIELIGALSDQSELLERIHAAAWDVTQTPASSCYLVTELLTEAGWPDPHAGKLHEGSVTTRRALDGQGRIAVDVEPF